MSDARRDWHHLFGLLLKDFFSGSPYEVEIDVDLSVKRQMLDVVVIRRGEGEFEGVLPDGFDPLAQHNLITFKSHQDTLDAWAIKELIGHYVNYRKQVSPSMNDLIPETELRLFGVCARYPQQLASQVTLNELRHGVYQCQWGTDDVRIIVPGRLPEEEQNSLLHLFSADEHRVQYGRSAYHPHSDEISTMILQLLGQYRQEGFAVPYTIEDWRRETREKALEEITVEELREHLPHEKLQKMIATMSDEEIEELLRNREQTRSSTDEGAESAN